MVDFIRAGINTYAQDPNVGATYWYAPSRANGAAPGETSVVPLVPQSGPAVNTKGIGRFPTVTEAALVFYMSKSKPDPSGAKQVADPHGNAGVSHPADVLADGGEVDLQPPGPLQGQRIGAIGINGQAGYFGAEVDNLVTSRCGYNSGGNHDLAFTGVLASFRRWAAKFLQVGTTTSGDQDKTFPHRRMRRKKNPDPEVNL